MSTVHYRARRGRVHGPEDLSSPGARPIGRSRTALVVAASIVALALAGPAAGSLKSKLDRALQTRGVSGSLTGATVYDLARSRFVYRHNAGRALKPASNEKLPVAVSALSVLGPRFRIPTELTAEGRLAPGGVWHGRLVLKGYGDPSLTTADIVKLARSVTKAGITHITGAVVGNAGYFDTVRTAPGWKPSYYKNESPPLSALIVNRAHFNGYMASNPALAGAKLLRAELRDLGVRVDGRAKAGTGKGVSVTSLRTVESPALKWLVRTMDRQSDNFYAEMLLKQLGARAGRGGTTSAGVRVVRKELRRRGVPLGGVTLADGSGLSAYDRLSAKAVTLLLVSASSDAGIGKPFVGSLAVAGVSGTLVDRMTSGPAHGNVRAKTGTTDSASALSGYVRKRYVFSILMNGSPIPWWYARQAQDRFAQVLARRQR
ncbi:MAG TPA: D-alanyl-D-alanine carboxypeptidase/D-alanyl-D-alanine-endopeptidase [Gaiellaceae bacterium]|jgi:D-alanyl-D-alanine carboxypeptidase/D-alanyl-D-alanine-endopeptidase (penicillin-binding protein 4)